MEKYITGIQLMIVGMGTVLFTLYLLSLLLRLSNIIFKESDNTGTIEREMTPAAETEKTLSGSEQMAAVMAAIYAYLEFSNKSYRIISIKRNDNSGWNLQERVRR